MDTFGMGAYPVRKKEGWFKNKIIRPIKRFFGCYPNDSIAYKINYKITIEFRYFIWPKIKKWIKS